MSSSWPKSRSDLEDQKQATKTWSTLSSKLLTQHALTPARDALKPQQIIAVKEVLWDLASIKEKHPVPRQVAAKQLLQYTVKGVDSTKRVL